MHQQQHESTQFGFTNPQAYNPFSKHLILYHRNTSSTMISNLFRARSNNTKQYVKFDADLKIDLGLLTSHCAPFEGRVVYQDSKSYKSMAKQPCLSTRKCYTCCEEKALAAFPLSVRPARHCRFCINLMKRNLDPTGVGYDGFLGMKGPGRTISIPAKKAFRGDNRSGDSNSVSSGKFNYSVKSAVFNSAEYV